MIFENRLVSMEILEDIELKKVGLELMFLTPEKCSREGGISAVELSKSLDIPLETVKKKLKILLEKGMKMMMYTGFCAILTM